jgi:hypothetical protein
MVGKGGLPMRDWKRDNRVRSYLIYQVIIITINKNSKLAWHSLADSLGSVQFALLNPMEMTNQTGS